MLSEAGATVIVNELNQDIVTLASNSGATLARLGRFYAQAITESALDFDVLFGPAYKGIPIATTTTVALYDQHQLDVPYCFNRKEAKTHGEGGSLVGAELKGKVMLVDDVITAGTAIRESMEIIKAHNAELSGVLIALDRQEKGQGELSAIQEVERDFTTQVISIVTLADVVSYLTEKLASEPTNKNELAASLASINQYRQDYGI